MAISVTTVPAAANAAVAFSYGDYGQMWGSVGQLLVNLAGHRARGDADAAAQKALWAVRRRRTAAAATSRA